MSWPQSLAGQYSCGEYFLAGPRQVNQLVNEFQHQVEFLALAGVCRARMIVCGGERISYMGLQIALVFDLGFLQGYGPPHNIDPLRDRFIGILLGLCILAIVFSLLWPESAESIARERLAAALHRVAQLLGPAVSDPRSQSSISEREQLELDIASSLSDANSYVEQGTFEAMLYGRDAVLVSSLAEAVTAVGV